MATYTVKKNQTKEDFVYLRIMIYTPNRFYLKLLQKRFMSNSEMFLYLFSKYNNRWKNLANLKNSSKKKYQQITCNYSNIGIRVSQGVHQTLKDLSDVTGFSMSALVGFLIEWECFNRDTEELGLFPDSLLDPLVIVITKIEIKHEYTIIEEKVQEELIFGYT